MKRLYQRIYRRLTKSRSAQHMPNLNARFVNFWPNFRYSEQSASHRFLFSSLAAKPLLIGSVFGRCPDVLDVTYSGECISSLRHRDDFFVWDDLGGGKARWFYGTPRIDHSRAFWQPHFYSMWAEYRDARHAPLQALWRADKRFGVSVVMRNFSWGGLAKRRAAVAHALSHLVPVHANSAMRDRSRRFADHLS